MVLVWFLSLLFHVGVMGVLWYIPFSLGVPRAASLPDVRAGFVGSIDRAPSRVPPAPLEPVRIAPSGAPALTAATTISVDVAQVTIERKTDLSIIGVGAGVAEAVVPTRSSLSIEGVGGGSAGMGGGDGLGIGGMGGPEFFGVGGSAKGVQRIVYVVDRSASMIDTFHFVQAELKRSVSALRRSQQFHVIFFASGPLVENPPQRLVHAVASHKEQFYEFLAEITPKGGTKPEAALSRALALKPDLIYLLSDGIDFDPELLRKLDEWNRDRRARIFTIAYLDPGGRQILERIAQEHNGECRFVSEHNLP